MSRLLTWLLASLVGFAAPMARAQVAQGALPTGGKVVVGSGQIVQGVPGSNVLQINQSSQRLGLDWQSFNIGSGATVEFRQPGADAVALNRVLGNSGSEIYGRLKANGQVFLTNPNGILFAPGAQVDVGGLVASTLDLSHDDFASGRYLFSATGSGGEVVNRGSLSASAGGYLALFGHRVSNEGQLSVNAGSVVLASGRASTVSISGSGLISAVVSPGAAGSVVNSGSISADGSVVTLSAHSAEAIASSLVNNSGIIRANSIVEKGGEVWITGDRAVQTGRIEVDAAQGLAAGKVTIKGDMSKGSVEVGGSISARSLDGSGAGGAVETSAAHVKVAGDARVDTRGKAGAYGTWTIDPTDFTVSAGDGVQTESGIGANTLSTNLGTTSVSLATAATDPAGGAQPGDLRVNAAVSWSADTTLTLQASRNIEINAPITATGATAGLVLTPGGGGLYRLNNGAKITLSGATPTLNIAGVAYTVINSLGLEGSTTGTDLQGVQGNLSRNYALGSDIDASATAGWSGGFKPIGDCSYYCNPFQGRFDGLGHSITGLQIDRSAEYEVGLFGYAQNAAIRNLDLAGSSVRATRGDSNTIYAGGVLGRGYQVSIENVRSGASVTAISGAGTAYTGGVFGYVENSYTSAGISRSAATGAVYSDGYYAYAGGLGGYYYSYNYYGSPGYIEASSASGRVDVRASYYAYGGGLLGYSYVYGQAGGLVPAVAGSSASGAVSAVVGGRGYSYGYAYLGGLIGYAYYGNLSGSQASGAVSAEYAAGASSGDTYLGGLVGYGYYATIGNSQASGAVGGGASGYAGGLVGYLYNYSASTTSPALDNVSASGTVTGRQYVGGLGGGVIGSVRNAFASGEVQASGTSSYAYAGGLIGYAETSSAGGIVDSVATGKVTGGSYTGGLIGLFYLSGSGSSIGIVNSHANGDVRASAGASVAGGLVGEYNDYASSSGSQAGISGSHATGNVSGAERAGGLVGSFNGYRGIADSYATGTVETLPASGDQFAGGLVGIFSNRAYGSYGGSGGTGGIVRSFASGSVTIAGQTTYYYGGSYAGGLVGYLSGSSGSVNTRGIEDSYATGNVSTAGAGTGGTAAAGGLAGYQYYTTINRGYASGAVSGPASSASIGGLVGGRVTGSVQASASYWNTETSGQSTSQGGTGLTTAQMRQAANFAGWSMRNSASANGETWRIYEGRTAPLLSGFLTPASLVLAGSGSRVYDGTDSFAGITLSGSGGVLARPERIHAVLGARDVGTYAVDASQMYSSQLGYDLSVSGSTQLTITKRPLSLTGVVADKVYDGSTTAQLVAGGQPSGLVAGEDLTVNTSAVSASFSDKNAGVGKTVTVSGYVLADGTKGKASNYDLANSSATTASIAPAALTVGGFAATSREYNGSTTVQVVATPASSLGGLVSGDTVTVDLSAVTGSMSDRHAGTGKKVTVAGASLGGTDAANYQIAGIGQVTVDITPKTVTVNGITATNKTYDGGTSVSLNANGATLAGLVAADQALLGTSTLTGSTADKNAGNGKAVTVSGLYLVGPEARNYTPQVAPVTVDVAKRPVTVYAYDNSYRYDSACRCYVYIYQADKVYDGTTAASISLSISNSADYGLTASASSITYDNRNVGTNKVITASGITLGGSNNVADNYVLQNSSATYNSGKITPKPLTVSGVTATNRPYDGTTSVTVNLGAAAVDTSGIVTVGGVTDDVSVLLPGTGTVVGTVASKNVGTNKPVTVPGLALSGTDAGNYTLSGAGGVTVNITKKDVTATYTASDKVYDGSTQVKVTATSGDFVSGDNVGFYSTLYTTPYYSPYIAGYSGYGYSVYPNANLTGTGAKNVGTAKPVSITSDYLIGSDAGNYNFVNANTGTATASVTPKPITPVLSVGSKVYDGTTTATVALDLGGSGIVRYGSYCYYYYCYYDNVSISTTTASFADKNVGSKTVSVSGITLTGADAGNYTLNATTASGTGNITVRPVTISGITATNRAYDGTTTVALTAGTVTSSGFVGGDDIAVSLPAGGITTGTVASANVGTAKPVTVTGLTLAGTDATNYTIDGTSTTVDIGRRPVTVSYTGVSREYNGGVSASVIASSSDVVSSDLSSIGFTQNAVFAGFGARNAGTGKTINVSNIALTGAGAANYELTNTTATTTADITPRTVTVTYLGQNRVYNGVADVSATVTGGSGQFIVTDQVSLSQTARFAGDGSAGVNKTVDISNIALSGADAGNYQLGATTSTTTATILPKAIGVTGITATDRVYDGTNVVSVNATGARVDTSGVIVGDSVTVILPGSGITTGVMADRHAGVGKAVTVSGLSITGGSASNYVLADGSGATVTIAPKAVTAVYTAASKVYDGSTSATVSASSAEFLSVDGAGVGISATGSFIDGKNVGADKPVAVSGGFLTGAYRGNYELSNPVVSTTASITARTLTPSYAGGSKVYDGSASAPVTHLTSGIVSGDQLTIGQTAVFSDGKNVGNGKPIAISGIALGGADAGNYVLAADTASATGAVTPKPITVGGLSSVTATNRVYDGTTEVQVVVPAGVTLTPNSSDIVAGDAVTVNVPSSGITTGTVASKNVGIGKPVSVTGLTLEGTDAGNYLIAGTAGITVDISRKGLTAIYAGVNRIYDGTANASVTGSALDIVAGDSVGITGSGVFTDGKNVGTAKPISVQSAGLQGSDAGNYTLLNPSGNTNGTAPTADVTARTVTASYAGGTKVYDGADTAPVTASAGFIGGDSVGLSQTAVFSGGKNVGSGKPIAVTGIALTGTDAGNYQLNSTTATASGSITPKSIGLIGLTGITATDRVYDGTRDVTVNVNATGAVTVNSSDIVAGDSVTVSVPAAGTTTGTVADKNVGSSKPVNVTGLGLSGTDAGNYIIAAAQGVTVNITPKSLTATYVGNNKIYDGTPAATVTGSSAAGEVVAGDSVSITGAGVFDAGKNVGAGKAITVQTASLGGGDAGNYRLSNPTGTATADITPKAVTASYTGGTRVYDGTTSAPVTGSAGGLVAGDSVNLTQASAVFTDGKSVGTGKPVSVTGIVLAGGDAGNYQLTNTSASTTASVTPKSVLIEGLTGVTATDRVYDGTKVVAVTVSTSGAAVSLSSADVVAGDVVGINVPASGATTGTMTDKNVGTAKPVSVAGLELTGADAGNYVISNASAVTVNITPKPLTAAYSGVNKVYDGTAAAAVNATTSDIVVGDSVTITASGVFRDGKAAGTGKAIDVQSAALGSADAGNYALLNPSGSTTADITPKPVTASFTGGTRVYDGTAVAPVSGSALGLITADAVSLVQTATFTDGKSVGTNKPVSVTGVSLTGADAGNYNLLTTSGSAIGTVTPRPVTIAGLTGVTATDRAYDGTKVVAVTISATGPVAPADGDIIAGDNVTVTAPAAGATTGQMADKNVGTGKAVAVTGLQLSGPDAGNYVVAATQGLTVNITPKSLTALYSGVNKAYDGTAQATVTGSSAGIVSGDAVSISGTGVFTAGKNVGVGKAIDVQSASLGSADAGNYTLANPTGVATADITPKPVTATYTGGSRVYDQSIAAPVTGTSADFIAGDKVTLTESAVFTGAGAKNVGTGKPVAISSIALAGEDAANYALQNLTAATTGAVTPRPISVAGLGAVTAVDRIYDGTTLVQLNVSGSLSASSSDILAGDDVSLNLPAGGAATGTTADKNVGTAKPVTVAGLALSGADAGNYTVAGTPGVTVNITPRLVSLTGVTGVDRAYDGSTVVALNTSNGGVVGAIAGDSVALPTSGATGATSDKNAGSAKPVTLAGVGLTGSDSGNYAVADTPGVTVNITPRMVSVTGVSGVDRAYDGTTTVSLNASAATVAGLVAGDAVSLTTATATGAMADKNVGSAKAVTVAGVTLSGADAGNYAVTGTPGVTVNITPRAVGVAGFTGVDRVYDGTTAVSLNTSAATVAGLVAGDAVSLTTTATGSTADKNVGTAKTVTVAGVALSGADAGNYTVAAPSGVTVNITPRPVSVGGITGVDRAYDGTAAVGLNAAAAGLNGAIPGDDVSVNLPSGGTVSDRNVGTGKPVAVAGVTLGGADAGNYVLSPLGAIAVNISPASATVTANSMSKVYGNALNFTGTEFVTSGMVAGESIGQVTLSSAGAAASAGVSGSRYAIQPLDARGGTFDPANYRITYLNGSLSVTPRPVTLLANSVVRFADEPNPSNFGFSTSIGGLVGGDTIGSALITLPQGSATAPGGSVFELLPSRGTFTSGDAANYAISYASGLLVVLPKPPRLDDVNVDGQPTGNVNFVVQVDPAEIDKANSELERTTAAVAQPRRGIDTFVVPPVPAAPQPEAAGLDPAAALAAMISGDSRRITLPVLRRLPLLSFDPQLKRSAGGEEVPPNPPR